MPGTELSSSRLQGKHFLAEPFISSASGIPSSPQASSGHVRSSSLVPSKEHSGYSLYYSFPHPSKLSEVFILGEPLTISSTRQSSGSSVPLPATLASLAPPTEPSRPLATPAFPRLFKYVSVFVHAAPSCPFLSPSLAYPCQTQFHCHLLWEVFLVAPSPPPRSEHLPSQRSSSHLCDYLSH